MSDNNNNTPKTRKIDESRTLDSLFPNRFLKASQLVDWNVTQIQVTISRLVEEEVMPRPGAPAEWKPVVYFRTKNGDEYPQGYLLSAKADKDSLKAATGAERISELIGKAIVIKLATWKSKTVLRIDPAQVISKVE